MSARFPSVIFLVLAPLGGCAASSGASPGAATPSGSEAPPDAGSEQAAGPVADTTSAAAAPTAVSPSAPLPAGEEPTPDKALPELRVEALGMHIGGGTNTPEEKAPFHHALQQSFPAFLECYRLVEDPWAGGSFGVDLKVSRAGGVPRVEQPRTRLRGTAFRDCMLAAFDQVHFAKPKAGPTVLSYSVMFTLGKAKQ